MWNISSKSESIFLCFVLKRWVEKCVIFLVDVFLDIVIKNDDFVEICYLMKLKKVDFNCVGCNGFILFY